MGNENSDGEAGRGRGPRKSTRLNVQYPQVGPLEAYKEVPLPPHEPLRAVGEPGDGFADEMGPQKSTPGQFRSPRILLTLGPVRTRMATVGGANQPRLGEISRRESLLERPP